MQRDPDVGIAMASLLDFERLLPGIPVLPVGAVTNHDVIPPRGHAGYGAASAIRNVHLALGRTDQANYGELARVVLESNCLQAYSSRTLDRLVVG